NSVKVAEITKIGKTTMGFLLIATFTTLPELSVSIFSTMDPKTIGIAIGNVLGSNIVNVCLILGISCLILSLGTGSREYNFNSMTLKEMKDFYFGIFIASLIPLVLCYVGYVNNIIGIILVMLFIAHNLQLIKSMGSKRDKEGYDLSKKNEVNRCVLLTLIGALGVVCSAYMIIESASFIAIKLGIPKIIIGATLVAFGTSLPELANSVNATRKGHFDLVLGNIIGSCFINITLILGVALIGGPFRVEMAAYSSLIIFSIMSNLLLWYFLSSRRISWKESLILIFMYALFIFTSFGARQP
ncbi:MAG: sodium:calcium antiporter, partial [Candidatus Bathyarchaeia archaeon]